MIRPIFQGQRLTLRQRAKARADEDLGDESGDETDSRLDGDDDMPATAAAIAAVLKSDPTLQPADVVVKINRSVRTVRRHWKTAAEARPAPTTPPTRSRDTHHTQEDADEDNAAHRR